MALSSVCILRMSEAIQSSSLSSFSSQVNWTRRERRGLWTTPPSSHSRRKEEGEEEDDEVEVEVEVMVEEEEDTPSASSVERVVLRWVNRLAFLFAFLRLDLDGSNTNETPTDDQEHGTGQGTTPSTVIASLLTRWLSVLSCVLT
jgi:hypothetical protein